MSANSQRQGPGSIADLLDYPARCLREIQAGEGGGARLSRLARNLLMNCLVVSDYSGLQLSAANLRWRLLSCSFGFPCLADSELPES